MRHEASNNLAAGPAAGDDRERRYRRKNLRMIGLLLAIWALVTFGVGYFARDLDFDVLGWPFSFWMAAQGAVFVYVLIIGWYARYMNRVDREFGMDE
jgi:putative solute:sodium symporter small subunit